MNKLITINISLPEKMYADVKNIAKNQSYSSTSEVIRDALRRMMHSPYSQNEVPQYLADAALEAEKEPSRDDIVLKSEKGIDEFFNKLHD